MIISTEAITWFLIGKKIDDKTIFKLSKFIGLEIPGSLRKNITNSFSKKHNQSETTILNIKSFVKQLCKNKSQYKKIDEFDFSTSIGISTPELNLKYVESGYFDFFKDSDIEGSFINHEIKEIFEVLKCFFMAEKKGKTKTEIVNTILENKLLSSLNLHKNILVDIGDEGIFHGKFSLNVLLYLFACLDVENKNDDVYLIQLIFTKLLSDVNEYPNKLETAFNFYITLLQEISKNKGKKLSFSEISNDLNIEIRIFNFYKSGHRNVSIKHLATIIDNNGILYFCIVFWKRYIEKFKDSDAIFIKHLDEYSRYIKIAKSRFEKHIDNNSRLYQ